MTDQIAPEGSRFGALMREPVLTHLFLGAVAVCESGTLVTSSMRFLFTIKDLQDVGTPNKVPKRLWPLIEECHIGEGHLLPVSDDVDQVFWSLNFMGKDLGWTYEETGGRYIGARYYMEDDVAAKIVEKRQFSTEELEWLWQFAGLLHVLPEQPLARRGVVR